MNQQQQMLLHAAQKIERMTADNDHCGALVVVADLVGIARHKTIARAIMQIRDAVGYVDDNLDAIRRDLYKSLEMAGSARFGDDWRIVWSSL
jgi:hypothetical protein